MRDGIEIHTGMENHKKIIIKKKVGLISTFVCLVKFVSVVVIANRKLSINIKKIVICTL